MPQFRLTLAAGLLGITATLALPAAAQQVYRIVGPDGRVTFSDKPPVEPAAKAAPVAAGARGASSVALPFELREAVNRYPVTLYTGADCGGCSAGRALLTRRGVPFTEKTVTTKEDIEALQRLTGANALPFLMLGSQQIKGYSEADWSQFLDAAGYPKSSQLPGGYRNPMPSPLVAQERAPTPAPAPAETARTETPSAPPPSAAENPAGIRF